jgi:hypothetical protein
MNKKKNTELPDNDWVALIPDKEIRAFENIYDKIKQALEALQKVTG